MSEDGMKQTDNHTSSPDGDNMSSSDVSSNINPSEPVKLNRRGEPFGDFSSTDSATTPISPVSSAQADQASKRQRSNKGGLILCIIIIIAIVAVVSVFCGYLIWGNKKTEVIEDNVEDTTETAKVVLENTPLTSGSVTTTVGDKEVTYNAAYLVDGIEATIGSGTYESASDNQNVFVVINGGKLTIQGEDITISKTGTISGGQGDDYSFYGTNAAIVVVGNGSSISIDGATITTEAGGANAVVATNSGTAKVQNTTIRTSANGSRGLHATYKGTITADGVNIATQGQSSASLATDRGEGTVKADNMTLATAGAGSPLVYSTGNITVNNSKGTATGAQIAVVEGSNSITLYMCNFSANGNGNRNGVDNAGIMIYQSMSGDAAEGRGEFSADASSLTIEPGSSVYASTPMFFVTNTTARIDLHDTELSFSDGSYFISALSTTEWGRTGSNGGIVEYSVSGTTPADGNIQTDSISSVSKV